MLVIYNKVLDSICLVESQMIRICHYDIIIIVFQSHTVSNRIFILINSRKRYYYFSPWTVWNCHREYACGWQRNNNNNNKKKSFHIDRQGSFCDRI